MQRLRRGSSATAGSGTHGPIAGPGPRSCGCAGRGARGDGGVGGRVCGDREPAHHDPDPGGGGDRGDPGWRGGEFDSRGAGAITRRGPCGGGGRAEVWRHAGDGTRRGFVDPVESVRGEHAGGDPGSGGGAGGVEAVVRKGGDHALPAIASAGDVHRGGAGKHGAFAGAGRCAGGRRALPPAGQCPHRADLAGGHPALVAGRRAGHGPVGHHAEHDHPRWLGDRAGRGGG